MKRKRFFKKLNNKGFTFVECICAIALFAIIGTMAFSMFSNATRYLSNAKKEEENNTEAQKLFAQEAFGDASVENSTAEVYQRTYLTVSSVTADAEDENASTASLYFFTKEYATSSGDKVTITVPISIVLKDDGTPLVKRGAESSHFDYNLYKTADGRTICIESNFRTPVTPPDESEGSGT